MNRLFFARSASVSSLLFMTVALIALAGPTPGPDAREDKFHFQRFLNLKSGDRFRIIARNGYAAGSAIGGGRLKKLSARELELDFQIQTIASGKINGTLTLLHLGSRDRYKERFRLRYAGQGPDGPESATETVLADSFLIRNGVLSLYFSDRRRFFQLSIDSRGRNSFITHWGASRLEVAR